MIIERLEVGLFSENCYIIGCEDTAQGVVIDPGDEAGRISARIEEHNLQINYILLTHAHLDHVKDVVSLREKYPVPVYMHRDDQFLLDNLPAQAAAFGLTTAGIPKVDRYLAEGDSVRFGNLSLDVLHTPGHSPGSVSFVAGNVVFSGDVLFASSIGRTDLPGGDFEILIRTINNKLLPLGDEVVVYPGHGPSTTVGQERLHNPFLRTAN